MADPTDVTLPITPAQISRGINAIVEQVHPRPRGENTMPVGEMERQLTAYAGDLIHAAYDDHAAVVARDLADNILGSVENGPWKLITDPNLRQAVGGYVADTCHTVAQAAGLPDVAEQVRNAVPPEGLPTGGRLVASDARERLARHLYITALGATLRRSGELEWDNGTAKPEDVRDCYTRADSLLAVIAGQEK